MTPRMLILTLCVGLSAAIGDLTVTKISRIIHDTGDHFEIEVTGGVEFDHYHLNLLYNDGEPKQQTFDSVDGTLLTTKKKATFEGDLNLFQGQDVEFLLSQREAVTDNEVTYGDLPIKLPKFPTTATSAWVGVDHDYSLRISDKDTITSFTFQDKACTPSDGTPCYFVDVTKSGSVAEFCTTVESVTVCDKTLTPTPLPATTDANPDTTELQYAASGTSATVSVAVSHATKAITSTEVIVYIEGDDAHVCTSSPCSIGSSVADDVLTVITVGIDDSNNPADTGSSTLTDYGIIGSVLSNSLIETRWTRQTDKDKYYVSTDGDGTASFTSTTVTCEDDANSANFHCFAYFTGLEQEKTYPLTVKIEDNAAPLLVTLTDTTTGKDEEVMGMDISSLNTKWNKGLRSFEVNACINHVETTNLSSYQAIIINKIGQWKKINGVTHKNENKFCFDELHMDVHNFDLSENLTLVAVKRGIDGITVVETAQTIISV